MGVTGLFDKYLTNIDRVLIQFYCPLSENRGHKRSEHMSILNLNKKAITEYLSLGFLLDISWRLARLPICDHNFPSLLLEMRKHISYTEVDTT